QRPRLERAVANPANAMTCAALIFSAFFVALNVVAHAPSLRWQLTLSGLATLGVFAGLPWLAAVTRRINVGSAFRLKFASGGRLLLLLPGAVLAGVGIWAWSHELLVWQMQLGLISISEQQKTATLEWIARARELHFVWLLLPFGLAPAVGEELFFRGYLFSALRGKAGPAATIVVTALLFGLFHVVTPGGITLVRLGPSTLAGLVLGWVAWRTGSVWPSMLLHGCHNSLLMAAAYYQPALADAGFGVEEESHLPLLWFAAATTSACIGLAWIALATRGRVGQAA
ncbi:MAG: lysostaphin resistance A-like protein, partial [Pirellulales bacterium]